MFLKLPKHKSNVCNRHHSIPFDLDVAEKKKTFLFYVNSILNCFYVPCKQLKLTAINKKYTANNLANNVAFAGGNSRISHLHTRTHATECSSFMFKLLMENTRNKPVNTTIILARIVCTCNNLLNG